MSNNSVLAGFVDLLELCARRIQEQPWELDRDEVARIYEAGAALKLIAEVEYDQREVSTTLGPLMCYRGRTVFTK